ncbi:hypothetical protein DSO57_1035383 [Entomophthora muscae]|uniref:Uncharacterized protein n=1 Tax=Entomophthora muscae TaxID=34485 RepID=A0ACC2RQJ8_9FUNG|nr:hypothetical protein DSO57_1035383 [Entomophthora muscae]
MYPSISGLDRKYQQDFLIRANAVEFGIKSQNYTQALQQLKDNTYDAIQQFMTESNINIIMVMSDNDNMPHVPASQAGLPIISIPAGITKDGFPFGVSFYTVPRHECLIFKLARAVEAVAPSRTPPTFL